ncbi:phage tail protein, partial [candidate division KSB1 bacterium]|nr:phage tail protein [Nitrospinaceae bacterium]NIR47980.1 phage tail protein [candidate division KSB1 bacterium]NIS23510.1 phage tail protein [candidate division KSB1 bacterium]NIT70446.1 phage tail protein [candidate division KSB1 bacterium]NIU24134.1 phage tail protein [candidate division KSB1 bacterium]
MYLPPVGFHFKVEFDLPDITDNDNRFREVSGISLEMEEETVTEGGENGFVHKLPVRAKYSDLVLKRGKLVDSAILKWCQKAIQDYEILPTTIFVKLLNEEHEPLKTYTFFNAWPKKWNISDFNAESSELVVETLELAFQYFTME